MSYRYVIWRGHFKKLWLSQILSLVAYNLLNFALIIRVFQLTQGTRFANVSVAMLVLSFGIPSILFAAVAGVYVDQWDRRKVLILTNFVRAVLAIGYLYAESSLALVLLLTFLIATATQFFAPAEAASIPRLVRRDHLITANALFLFTFYATFVVGYSASAPVIKFFGTDGPYAAAALLFAVATALAMLLPHMGQGEDVDTTLHQNLRTVGDQLRHSWKLIRGNINLYFPIIQLMLIQVMISVIMVLAPALSLALLKAPLQDASHFLVLPAGIGMVFGVVLVNRIAKWVNNLGVISSGLVISGAGLIVLGMVGLLYRTFHGNALATIDQVGVLTALIVFVLGIVIAVISVTAQTILQENTTDHVRGKIFGALYTLINAAATLPVLLVGLLADLFSVTKVISATGALVLIFALLQLGTIRHKRRKNPKIDL
jgi:predicted MFS family arabinose efflux permease